MSYRVAFLDLDDTLYPPASGVWNAIGERIQVFMMDRLGLSYDQTTALRRRYFEQYGTTLNGLWHNHAVDPQEYLAFVHAVPLEEMLHPDPDLAGMLHDLPQKRVVFTNANLQHAERVLACLGIARRSMPSSTCTRSRWSTSPSRRPTSGRWSSPGWATPPPAFWPTICRAISFRPGRWE